jgi:hypothetical protein
MASQDLHTEESFPWPQPVIRRATPKFALGIGTANPSRPWSNIERLRTPQANYDEGRSKRRPVGTKQHDLVII